MKKTSFVFNMLMILVSTSVASAGNGEMKGFRFQECEANVCTVVEAPKAWLSQANGSFVASGEEKTAKDAVKLQLIEDGKVKKEFRGDEIVSQPEIHTMTVESAREVILVDVQKRSFEVIPKSFSVPTRIERGAR